VTHASVDVAAGAGNAPAGAVGLRSRPPHSQISGRAARRAGAGLEELLAILCLFVVVCIDVALLRVGLDAMDEGYFVEQATRALRGDLPYRDFDSLYTPGLLYLHAALFGVLGETHVLVPRMVGLIARVLLAGGLYVVCRPLARPIFAILPGLYVLVGLDQVPLTWEPHPGWPSAALTVLAAWAFGRLPRLSVGQHRYWLLLIGALSGLVFAFKQNAGVFLILALVAFAVWQGVDATKTSVTRALRAMQVALLTAVVLATAWLVRPSDSEIVALYFLVPLGAAGVATLWGSAVSADGRALGSWVRVVLWVGLGWALVTLPWLVALVVALEGRLDLLKGFVGAVDHSLLWHPLIGPSGGAWAALVGAAVAALLALRVRQRVAPLCAALALVVVFAASGVLLTAEPGETIVLAALMAPGRAATGLPIVLPVTCILAGAWLSLRSPPTLARWQLRWLTVAGALTFLTQYPRMDDVHLAWSAGLPLATGAVVLGHLHTALAARWALGQLGRVVLVAVLVLVPAASVLPGLAERGHEFVDVAQAGHLMPRLEATTTVTSVPSAAGVIVTDEQSATLLAAIRFVQAHTAPGEPIFVYPSSPLVYVAVERPNPTRFSHLYPGAASPEELQSIIATLERTPVRVVVVSGEELAFWGPPAGNEPLEEYLSQSYGEIARFGPYRVLLRAQP